ncbi:glutaminyl-peptide cyclotransferase [Dyella choica]|uniref:Glutaminyl-peptide cyclotransferase n=1 Tax=Dyella choica TaxID=1927959 RepID=A0A3S0RJH6_9GAMM|nr:glutaminyl-peptide cyclotransferase [Dyella choica]RUL73673.1 glutaminyl-peptide cyclotransferase [Dyella choica]
MKPITRLLAVFALLLASSACAQSGIPIYGYEVVHTYPHDTKAYTEGLFFLDGYLYESTGTEGASFIHKLDLDTGKVLQQVELPPPDYGEGIVTWKNRLIQLTWQSQHGYVYDLKSFKRIGQFSYPGEGWALTRDSTHIYMSDGTPTIRVLDPETLKQVGRIDVTFEGRPLVNLNELEWVKDKLYANVWLTHNIVEIDPANGKVVGVINLTGLGPGPGEMSDPENDVLNGIAYDAKRDRLFVTGKRWPKIYEIKLVPPKSSQ